MAMVATGTPGGIWTVASNESIPFKEEESMGTPITGTVVWAANTPARCAAIPAPAMITLTPRSRAVSANSADLVGNTHLLQKIHSCHHDREIRVTSHNDTDFCFSCHHLVSNYEFVRRKAF
jgi:hypothetical protein